MATSIPTLSTLVRLRQRELDDAREHLADCLARELGAMNRLREAEAAIRLEQAAAAALDASDTAVETFAAWLPRGRAAVAEAERARIDTQSATVQARTRLVAARAAAEAASELRDAATTAIRAERDRRLQAELDEVGRRLHEG